MDYEKKYKEALGWMQSLHDGLHGATKEEAEHYFPELKESKDERIRKWLLNFVKGLPDDGLDFHFFNLNKEQVLNWLEKQGQACKSIVWHDITEEPNEDEEILCEWESDDATWHDVGFYHPKSKTFGNEEHEIKKVVKWAYLNEREGNNE